MSAGHDITHDFPIAVVPELVFAGVSTPAGLDTWWTKRSSGVAALGGEYELGFGPQYDWRARVTQCLPNEMFELELTRADEDWLGTRVGFQLSSMKSGTLVRFHHRAWPAANEHFRISCYCWAMYLRILKRNLEYGEVVPYEQRLEV